MLNNSTSVITMAITYKDQNTVRLSLAQAIQGRDVGGRRTGKRQQTTQQVFRTPHHSSANADISIAYNNSLILFTL